MYSAKINGEPTTFGTSGMLYRSNKVMYDRLTETLWSQLRGEPILGELVGSGIKLEYFPVALTTWESGSPSIPIRKFSRVRRASTRLEAMSVRTAPVLSISHTAKTRRRCSPIWNRDERLAPKQLVFGIVADGAFKAYSIDALRQDRIVNDSIGGVDLVVVGSSLSADALAFRSDGRQFTLPDDAPLSLPDTLFDDDGAVWHVERDRLWKDDDPAQALPLHPANVSFWFGWYITHPDTLLYGAMGN